MNATPSINSWRQRLFSALMLLLMVAGAARLVWELLSAVVLPLLVLLGLAFIYWFIFQRRRL